jgi:hypothetical protein
MLFIFIYIAIVIVVGLLFRIALWIDRQNMDK